MCSEVPDARSQERSRQRLAGSRYDGLDHALTRTCCLVLREGSSLWEILAAGEWSSPAFLKYMDLNQLETDLVLKSHLDDSDCDQDE